MIIFFLNSIFIAGAGLSFTSQRLARGDKREAPEPALSILIYSSASCHCTTTFQVI